MPSIAQAPISPLNNRKRRREDDESIEVQMKFARFVALSSEVSLPTNSQPSSPRHAEISPANEVREEMQHLERRPILANPRRCHDSKRLRVEKANASGSDFHGLQLPSSDTIQHHSAGTTVTSPQKKSVDLSPCHICRRKPTVRSELDAFANCEGCGKRTCYVCIRECLGSAVAVSKDTEMIDALSFSLQREESFKEEGDDTRNQAGTWGTGHRGMVCSRCCVERGTEGEVLCLGCLRAEEAA